MVPLSLHPTQIQTNITPYSMIGSGAKSNLHAKVEWSGGQLLWWIVVTLGRAKSCWRPADPQGEGRERKRTFQKTAWNVTKERWGEAEWLFREQRRDSDWKTGEKVNKDSVCQQTVSGSTVCFFFFSTDKAKCVSRESNRLLSSPKLTGTHIPLKACGFSLCWRHPCAGFCKIFFSWCSRTVLSSQAFLCKPRVVYPYHYSKARKALWPLFSGHFSFLLVRNRINPFNAVHTGTILGIWVYLHQSFQRRQRDRHGDKETDAEQSFKAWTSTPVVGQCWWYARKSWQWTQKAKQTCQHKHVKLS